MNKNYTLDESTFKFLYQRTAPYYIPVGFIISCVVVVFTIILPQFQAWNDSNVQAATLRQKIAVLEANKNVINTIDSAKVDSQFNTISQAFPTDKDFISIINTITAAANVSQISLDDFSFSVGSLATESASLTPGNAASLDVSLKTESTVPQLEAFIHELSQRFPLSEISTVLMSNTGSMISISFYYKPFPENTVNVNLPIKPLSQSNEDVINTLASYAPGQATPASGAAAVVVSTPPVVVPTIIPIASPSAIASPSGR